MMAGLKQEFEAITLVCYNIQYMSEARIAPFEPSDVHELACFAIRAYADTYGYVLPQKDLGRAVAGGRWVEQLEEAAEADSILVSRLGNRIVGYAQFGSPHPQEQGPVLPDSKELRKLYIASDLHGLGFGRQLMNEALADPGLATAPQVYLWVWGGNPRAIRFYEHYDFSAVAARHYWSGDRSTHDLIMVRNQT